MLKLYRKLDKIQTKLVRQQQRLDSLNSVKAITLNEIRIIKLINCPCLEQDVYSVVGVSYVDLQTIKAFITQQQETIESLKVQSNKYAKRLCNLGENDDIIWFSSNKTLLTNNPI